MTFLTEPSHAVFLSYASQDAEAARSIAEALRGAGIEVWFDQTELRGGDAWDRQIRKQIHDCALFLPLISAHSQERLEGYFRREWKLAVDRTHGMAEEKAFLVPVVIDGTSELDASVPDKFRDVQWSRLPAGDTPPAFVHRVQGLLEPALPISNRGSVGAQTGPQSIIGAPVRLPQSKAPALLVAAALLALATVAHFIINRPWTAKSAPPARTATAPTSSDDNSIAVLPFADLSEKKDQQYFADGMSEELVGVLGKLPGLRVIEHGSSFRLRGMGDDPRNVGTQLGSAHIVQGSVRRVADHVRVTTQLLRTSDGAQEWSGTFDRDVQDILQVQSEIAASVGRSLQLSVAAVQDGVDQARPSAEAYDLYLRALHANDRVSNEGMQEALAYLQRALELDPHFVRAQEALASTHLLQAVFGAVPADTGFGRVRDDATRLLQLDPRSGWGQTLLCRFHTEYSWDWPEAERQCAAAVALAPRFWLALYAAADLAMIRGDYAKAERLFRKIFPIDPLNADAYMELGLALRGAGRLADAEAAFRRGLAITPTYITGHLSLGSVLLIEGRFDDARQAFELEAPEYGRDAGLAMADHAGGRTAEANTALKRFIQDHGSEQPYIVASVYAYSGATDQAFDWLERAYQQRDPLMPYIKGDVLVRSLQRDQRYKAFLQKMKLAE